MSRFQIYEEILTVYLNFYHAGLKNSNLFRSFRGSVPKKSWQIVYTFFSLMTKHFLSGFSKKDNLNKLVWAFVLSTNNYNALKFLRGNWNGDELTFVAFDNKNVGTEVHHISTHSRFLYSFNFFSIWIKFYSKHRLFALEYFNLIFYSVGYYETLLKKLKKSRPKAIIFSNDHNIDARALLLAAKSLNVKTVYIQHAAVSKYFPRLIFDLALLEGEISRKLYEECGPAEGQIELIGMPKFDDYLLHRKSKPTEISKLGITLNYSDDWEMVFGLIKALQNALPEKKLTMRPHPLLVNAIKPIDGVGYSNSVEENAFDFLKGQDLIIAANSSILLEATMLNVKGIYFNSGSSKFDYYGFVANGLVQNASSIEEVIEIIKDSVFDKRLYLKTKPYNYAVGTEMEGKSQKLAEKYIRKFILE